ncbi:MAG: TIGR00375 family protein [Candidatus Nanohaloarchaea archaeon]
MRLDVDLHIHGKHSGGVSDRMEIPVLADEARKKGLDVVGSGDILNPKWLSHVMDSVEGEGVYTREGTDFLLTTEVEDENRVHHLLVFPSASAVKNAFEDFKKYSDDIRREGRPRIRTGGEKIVELAKKHDALVGPAHAFTPYTALYGNHDSLEECYGSWKDAIDFLELGLSADSSMAGRISDHDDLVFLSNSDAHSPWPHRLGREFNRIQVREKTFSGIRGAILNRNVELNVGLDPREGKYHCTACNSCYQKYSLEQAERFDWRCKKCGGALKKGVRDRVDQLADSSPEERPEYLHLPPLANIIMEVVGHSSPTTKTVQRIWDDFNENHGAEIDVLVEEDVESLKETNHEVGAAIKKFREGETVMIPGGGGEYGEMVIPGSREELERIRDRRSDEIDCVYRNDQETLENF